MGCEIPIPIKPASANILAGPGRRHRWHRYRNYPCTMTVNGGMPTRTGYLRLEQKYETWFFPTQRFGDGCHLQKRNHHRHSNRVFDHIAIAEARDLHRMRYRFLLQSQVLPILKESELLVQFNLIRKVDHILDRVLGFENGKRGNVLSVPF